MSTNPFDLTGRTIIISGVVAKSSIAWGIAESAMAQGASVILTCESEAVIDRVSKFAINTSILNIIECNAGNSDSIETCTTLIKEMNVPIQGFVHSIAWSESAELAGPYLTATTEKNFLKAMALSCFSFTSMIRNFMEIMENGSRILTLTYRASQSVHANYNAMGLVKAALEASVRAIAVDLGPRNFGVNAIDASPMKTPAASAIGNNRRIGGIAEGMSPLGRRATLEEIGNAASFLLSDASTGITGTILPVNCGAGITAHAPPWNAEKMSAEMSKVAEIDYPYIGKEGS